MERKRQSARLSLWNRYQQVEEEELVDMNEVPTALPIVVVGEVPVGMNDELIREDSQGEPYNDLGVQPIPVESIQANETEGETMTSRSQSSSRSNENRGNGYGLSSSHKVEQISRQPVVLPNKPISTDQTPSIENWRSIDIPFQDLLLPLDAVQPTPREEMRNGLATFFSSLIDGAGTLIDGSFAKMGKPVKALASGLLGAALFPVIGPVLATTAAITAVTLMTIQDELRGAGLDLQSRTIDELVKPLQGKRSGEDDLQKAIDEVLSKDKLANADLAKAFIALGPTIKEVAEAPTINILGDVYGLVVGDNNTINQTFNGFLKPAVSDKKLEEIRRMKKETNYPDSEIAKLMGLGGRRYPIYQECLTYLGL